MRRFADFMIMLFGGCVMFVGLRFAFFVEAEVAAVLLISIGAFIASIGALLFALRQ